jgi:hypothetical protein
MPDFSAMTTARLLVAEYGLARTLEWCDQQCAEHAETGDLDGAERWLRIGEAAKTFDGDKPG